MIAAVNTTPPGAMTAPSIEQAYSISNGTAQRMFKKHKVLPHPNRGRTGSSSQSPPHLDQTVPRKYELLVVDVTGSPDSQPSSLPSLKHQPKRVSSGPDLPPTPPAHSRTSSSSHSILPSSPTYVESPTQSVENTSLPRPVTPPNQMSPPTPEVTPPRPMSRPPPRPPIRERAPSKSTSDSRTESFKTAREDPYSSEEDESKSTVRPAAPSARTSQNTVRQMTTPKASKAQPVGLGLGLESPPKDSPTPRRKEEFISFDGDWASASEVEQVWDDNLDRAVTVRKRRGAAETPQSNRYTGEVVEDNLVTPTNAAKALRGMRLHDSAVVYPSPRTSIADKSNPWVGPSTSQSSISDTRRFSGMSSNTTASTVVEAILVDGPPKRQKTLRHVRKQRTLRDSSSDFSASSSTHASSSGGLLETKIRQPRAPTRYVDNRHESLISNGTTNSLSSSRLRREVWKNGGIPVVIVPERRSSFKSKSSREPSLRSTSSRRSRSVSMNSAQLLNGVKNNDLAPLFDRPSRRSRAMSESDGSDQRTIDYPPVVPKRTSSLSAPTSRNASRTGSLTTESLRAHNALQAQLQSQPAQDEARIPALALQPAPSFDTEKDGGTMSPGLQAHDDALLGRLTAHNTPFSLASVDTNGTALEVSEAVAVSMFPHQNSSILMVNHSAKPSDGSDSSQRATKTHVERPTIQTTGPDGEGPVTPPQPQFSMDDVDSPLRNPRAPPEPPAEPPAIKFIPATPSGLTPGVERQTRMGNYFEEIEQKPRRSQSLVRKVLSRRRHSEYGYPPSASRPGFLTRTLSLGRSSKEAEILSRGDKGKAVSEPAYPTLENPPVEGQKLHPFWRPAYSETGDEDDDWVRDRDDSEGEVYRYPPVDNRPAPPRRSLSSRMRRTFAILPLKPEDEYFDGDEGPDRRTIRRTPSGNLKVMRHRASLDSMRDHPRDEYRPYTAPDSSTSGTRSFWRGHSRSMSVSLPKSRLLPTSLSSKLEGLQNLPRRVSEKRREKRTQELRSKISGPREVRDGVGDVIRRGSVRDALSSE